QNASHQPSTEMPGATASATYTSAPWATSHPATTPAQPSHAATTTNTGRSAAASSPRTTVASRTSGGRVRGDAGQQGDRASQRGPSGGDQHDQVAHGGHASAPPRRVTCGHGASLARSAAVRLARQG